MGNIRSTSPMLKDDGKLKYENGGASVKKKIRVVEIPNGEIVLIGTKGSKRNCPATLGVVSYTEQVQNLDGYRGDQIYLSHLALRLLPEIEIRGRLVPRINTMPSKQMDSKRISEVIVGKRKVLERLAEDSELRIHCNWLKKLKRPYNFPCFKSEVIRYVDA